MKKTCAVSGQEFEISDEDLKFYEKMGVPVPTLCPEERERRRLSLRNERNLYWRTCDGTGKKILSIYSPDKPFKVYGKDYWYSDKWDPKSYGRDFDFSRPFFEQFAELMLEVPRMAVVTAGNENAEYVSYAGWNQNCYLVFDSDHNQDCYFLTHAFYNKDTVDCFYANRCQLCYECVTSYDCYDCRFCQDCKHCSESWFLKSCIGCKNCFGCVNLHNKEYYFLNEKCSKEEYFEKLKALNLHKWSSIKNMRKQFSEFIKKFPHKYYQGIQNEEVSGDYLDNCKNVHNSYNVENSRDSKYLSDCQKCKDCYDMDEWGGTGAELCYECHVVGEGAHNIGFCTTVWENVHDIFYSEYCVKGSHNLFGCQGLVHSSYCILNKQYSKKEYEELRVKIIEHMKKTGEWGEFFPSEISPFGYNETIAQEYFPLTKEEVLKRGWKWRDEDVNAKYEGPKYDIPDSIEDVADEILEKILVCEKTGKNYRLVKPELEFYRKMGLPIPRLCPDARYEEKVGLCNPRNLYERNCDKCNKEFETTFAPDRPEKVYCEKCYLECVD